MDGVTTPAPVSFQERIVVDPTILAGKPVIRGTRVPVELVLKRLAEDPNVTAVLEAFPQPLTTSRLCSSSP